MILGEHLTIWAHRISVADLISFVVQTAMATGVGAFAWWKGGAGERLSGAVFWLGWVAGTAVTLSGSSYDPPINLLWDVLMGVTFLYTAVRYNRLWLGAGLIAQGAQLGARTLAASLHEAPGAPVWVALGVGINLMNLAMMATLVCSTLAVQRDGRADLAQRA